jgi:hypothetical protein
MVKPLPPRPRSLAGAVGRIRGPLPRGGLPPVRRAHVAIALADGERSHHRPAPPRCEAAARRCSDALRDPHAQWQGSASTALAPLAGSFTGPAGWAQAVQKLQSSYSTYASTTPLIIGTAPGLVVIRFDEAVTTRRTGTMLADMPNIVVYRSDATTHSFTRIDVMADSVAYEAAACLGALVCNPHLSGTADVPPAFPAPTLVDVNERLGYTSLEVSNAALVGQFLAALSAGYAPGTTLLTDGVQLAIHASPVFWPIAGGRLVGKQLFAAAFQARLSSTSGITLTNVGVIGVKGQSVVATWTEQSRRGDTGKQLANLVNIVQFVVQPMANGALAISAVDIFVNSVWRAQARSLVRTRVDAASSVSQHAAASQACGGQLVCQPATAVAFSPASGSVSGSVDCEDSAKRAAIGASSPLLPLPLRTRPRAPRAPGQLPAGHARMHRSHHHQRDHRPGVHPDRRGVSAALAGRQWRAVRHAGAAAHAHGERVRPRVSPARMDAPWAPRSGCVCATRPARVAFKRVRFRGGRRGKSKENGPSRRYAVLEK